MGPVAVAQLMRRALIRLLPARQSANLISRRTFFIFRFNITPVAGPDRLHSHGVNNAAVT
jgi:hypothetical protein